MILPAKLKTTLLATLIIITFSSCVVSSDISYTKTHPLVESGRSLIGVVTKYDSGYYEGGYPPEDSGACSDVIERTLRNNNYDLKTKIDADMKSYPSRYFSDYDSNINFRRVRNIKIFLDNHAISFPTCTDSSCFNDSDWQAGDIVTFDQIPENLWHIAIVSNKTKTLKDDELIKIPYLIHNHGGGVEEDNMLLTWPAPISGHYRISEII